MRRKAFTLLTKASLILGVVSVAGLGGRAAPAAAVLKAVQITGQASGAELWMGIEGDFSFQTIQATDDTVFVDLTGVQTAGVPSSRDVAGSLLTGYRLLQYTDSAHRSVVRVEVELKHSEAFTAEKEKAGLRVLFGKATPTPPATPAATAEPAPVVAPPQAQAALAAQPAPVNQAAPLAQARPAVVSDISVKTEAHGQAVVEVKTSRLTSYKVLRLDKPARVVVDLEEARYTGRQRHYAAQSSLLKDVRVGQFRDSSPAIVRVVADLSADAAYDVHAQPNGVRIELKSRGLARPVARKAAASPVAESTLQAEEKPAPLTAEALPSAPGSHETSVEQRGSAALAPPAPKPEAPAATVAQTVAQPAPAANYQAVLPASAASSEVVAAPRPTPPAQTPESLRAARAARILAVSSEQNAATAQDQTPTAAPAAPAAPTAPPAQAASTGGSDKPQYTGEPISLNLKDVDLKDFFRLVHEISGLNLIIDPNVTGSVTLVLDSVPWDQALDIVLKNNHLDKVLEGNVLRIATMATLAAEQDEVKHLAEARVQSQPLVTVFRPINYAKAGTIATMLKSWVGGGALTSRGNILVDDRANTLIVSDIQSQIPIIESIITKLDKKAKQISIEARVILASSSFTRNLSSVLQGLTANTSGTTHLAGATGTGVSATPTTPPVVATATAGGFGVFAISNATSRYAIDLAIAAAESKSQAKTISRPSIVTQNNVSGSVQQGTQLPIQTTINNTISIQYINATLQLTVTPQVTQDGNIFMQISVQNASPGTLVVGVNPSINTQTATTQVMVPDGGTVVFGGVTVSQRSKTATYVPIIGNIPIIGHLFKSSIVSDSDNELLFFVTPKILPA